MVQGLSQGSAVCIGQAEAPATAVGVAAGGEHQQQRSVRSPSVQVAGGERQLVKWTPGSESNKCLLGLGLHVIIRPVGLRK